MHGHQESSVLPRGVATFMHAAAVAAATWLLLGGSGDPGRRYLLVAFAVTYLARATFGMLVLLRRKLDWGEAAIVTTLFVLLQCTFSILGSGAPAPLSWLDAVGIALFVGGSYLNTGSEYARYRWKKNPDNRGKLYTGGLFRYAMHINYLGDSVLFTGFAIVTRSPWALLAPALMTAGFVFQHIPRLDAYLSERYGDAFEAYARKTKKFIPYLY